MLALLALAAGGLLLRQRLSRGYFSGSIVRPSFSSAAQARIIDSSVDILLSSAICLLSDLQSSITLEAIGTTRPTCPLKFALFCQL